MHDDDLDVRLAAATERLASLSAGLEKGEPWPLAERFDHSPEASWGPRETLAHLEEMLGFWLGEAERIIESPDEGVAFGRAATDEDRLAIIERDRRLPTHELVERVRDGIDRWRERWPELDAGRRERTGTHPRLGVLTVADVASRFAVSHLEEHLDQLATTLGDAPAKD